MAFEIGDSVRFYGGSSPGVVVDVETEEITGLNGGVKQRYIYTVRWLNIKKPQRFADGGAALYSYDAYTDRLITKAERAVTKLEKVKNQIAAEEAKAVQKKNLATVTMKKPILLENINVTIEKQPIEKQPMPLGQPAQYTIVPPEEYLPALTTKYATIPAPQVTTLTINGTTYTADQLVIHHKEDGAWHVAADVEYTKPHVTAWHAQGSAVKTTDEVIADTQFNVEQMKGILDTIEEKLAE